MQQKLANALMKNLPLLVIAACTGAVSALESCEDGFTLCVLHESCSEIFSHVTRKCTIICACAERNMGVIHIDSTVLTRFF